jgi:large repetitive protein
VAADTPIGPLPNTASVTSTTADPNPGNNQATATTEVTGEADLAVTKAATPNPAVNGQNLTYTVTIVNNGPSTARAVQLSDALPTAFSFVSAAASQGSCGLPTANTLPCTLGDIPANANPVIVTVIVHVPPNYDGTNAVETVSVSSATPDPDATNNTASWTTSSVASADLTISKTAAATVAAGELLTYTLIAQDLGPSTAQGVVAPRRCRRASRSSPPPTRGAPTRRGRSPATWVWSTRRSGPRCRSPSASGPISWLARC